MSDQFDIDIEYAVLTETVIHPETRAVVAPAGARFMDAVHALIEVGADSIETDIGTITIGKELA